jgi:hypothetical protein
LLNLRLEEETIRAGQEITVATISFVESAHSEMGEPIGRKGVTKTVGFERNK